LVSDPDSPVQLTEYVKQGFPRDLLSASEGEEIWTLYRSWLDVEFPSPQTEWQWTLRSKGQVGFVPLPSGQVLSIAPRVPVTAIFRMWASTYPGAPPWRAAEVKIETLEELYDWIAGELAAGVLSRLARGLYQPYVERVDDLITPRGRIDLRRAIERHWNVALRCEYQELTPDVPDNQLLGDALQTASRSAAITRARPRVRDAYLKLSRRSVSSLGSHPRDCLGRQYSRLNSDYEWMHWLCHFILAGAGPTQRSGKTPIQGFQIDMPRLFEGFVASWLTQHLQDVDVERHEHLDIVEGLEFIPDLVLRTRQGVPLAVLDTKYKLDQIPTGDDVAQVIAYAKALGCTDAVLIYPMTLTAPMDVLIGDVRVRSLAFVLGDDLDRAGESLAERLAA
jgi:5-methylcytosine-specific restriction enzyme subunit McrC